MNKDETLAYVNGQILNLIQALRGCITAEMRAIVIDATPEAIELAFVLYQESLETRDEIEEIEAQFCAYQTWNIPVTLNILVDRSSLVEDLGLTGRVVFLRKEEERCGVCAERLHSFHFFGQGHRVHEPIASRRGAAGLPQEFSELLHAATEALRAHPKHDLNLGFRKRIWAALGSSSTPELNPPDRCETTPHQATLVGSDVPSASPSDGAKTNEEAHKSALGRARRTHLAVDAARMVLWAWELYFPDDRTPHEAITAAVDYLRGAASKEQALSLHARLWRRCDEVSALDAAFFRPEAGAGYAAAQALRTALEDELFDIDSFDDATTDQDVAPDLRDASFFAAATFANGPAREDYSSIVRRRAFWEWWLAEAVPRAWATACLPTT